MRYRDARPFIQDGDVIATAGPTFFSKMIRWWTREAVSHIGFAYWVRGRLCIFEASDFDRVRLVPLSWVSTRVFWYPLDVEINRTKVMDFAFDNWNRLYADPWQFAVIAIPSVRRIRRLFGKQMDTDPDRWFCSELVARALMAGGYNYTGDPALTTPGQITRFECLTHGIELR